MPARRPAIPDVQPGEAPRAPGRGKHPCRVPRLLPPRAGDDHPADYKVFVLGAKLLWVQLHFKRDGLAYVAFVDAEFALLPQPARQQRKQPRQRCREKGGGGRRSGKGSGEGDHRGARSQRQQQRRPRQLQGGGRFLEDGGPPRSTSQPGSTQLPAGAGAWRRARRGTSGSLRCAHPATRRHRLGGGD